MLFAFVLFLSMFMALSSALSNLREIEGPFIKYKAIENPHAVIFLLQLATLLSFLNLLIAILYAVQDYITKKEEEKIKPRAKITEIAERVKVCPYCERDNPITAKYCSYCGKRLE